MADHNSVAAFLGAFSAFVLVAVNDWRRRRRSKRQIRYLVSDNADLARAKHRTVQTAIDMLTKDGRVAPAPIMRFPVDATKLKQIEVIDMLNSNDNQALNALIHWMESIDGILDERYRIANVLREAAENDAPLELRTRLSSRMLTELTDAKRNLELLASMCDTFTAGRAHEILEMQVPIETKKRDA